MEPAASTSFIHDGVTMTEYENEPFIVGDFNHNQVEFMHLSHEKWYTASPILSEFGVKRIFGYAAVSRPGKVFLVGGYAYYDDYYAMSEIIVYKNDIWEPFGGLKHSRMNLMTITYGTDVMIIGGKTFEAYNEFSSYDEFDADNRTLAIEIFSMIDENVYDFETDLTNMVLPNAMFFNGISIVLNETSSCQETQIGMNIKIYTVKRWVIQYK